MIPQLSIRQKRLKSRYWENPPGGLRIEEVEQFGGFKDSFGFNPEPWALLVVKLTYIFFRLKPLAYMYSLIHSSPGTEDWLIQKHLPSILQCFFNLVATSGV